VIALVAAGVVAVVADVFSTPGSSGTGGMMYHTATYTVTRRSLSSQTQVDATLGYAGSYSVVNQAQGSTRPGAGGATLTSLPQPGAVVSQGDELYAVSGSPVVLLYGSTPAYRSLSQGQTGADVTELNTDLVAMGYVSAADLGPQSGWDYFSAQTAGGVQRLQARLGQAETGSLALGSAVFLPSAIVVSGYGPSVVAGGPATAGQVVLTGSSTTPVISVDLDASLQSEVHDGEPVNITLPDGSATAGVVSHVSTVASSSSGSSGSDSASSGSSGSGNTATITVLVSLDNPKAAGSLNRAPVVVTITTRSVPNALVVPVTALLAQPSGGYAVEAVGAGGRHHLVQVTAGLFDDAAGLVQVTGTGLAAGQKVVVAAT
jgi:hypothetical protein